VSSSYSGFPKSDSAGLKGHADHFFDRDAEHIVAGFVRALLSQPVPPIIYHYTNDVGLRGIWITVNSGLSDIFSLNDPSELRQ